MRSLTPALPASLAISLLLACGGGGGGGGGTTTPPSKTIADTLSYTDPAGTGFRLVRNTSLSTAGRLVLDLVGPSGATGHGVAVILSADQSRVTWSTPPSGSSVAHNVAFNPGTGTQALVGKTGGDQLQGGAFQKPGTPAVNLAQPLLRFSLDLKAGVPVNTNVSLGFINGNQLPAGGAPAFISVAVGTLIAQ